MLFNIFVGDMHSGIKCSLKRFADNSKQSGAVDIPEGKDAIQRKLDRLERWAHANLMKFNIATCKVLHLVWGNPKHRYSLGGEWVESSPEKKELGVSVNERFNISQQCVLAAQKTNCTLGWEGLCVSSVVTGQGVTEGRFRLEIWKEFLPVRAVRP